MKTNATHEHQVRRKRAVSCIAFTCLLVLLFGKSLAALAVFVAGSAIYSYILLIPFISAYLFYIKRERLDVPCFTSPGWGAAALLAGVAALGAFLALRASLSHGDDLSLLLFSFVAFLWAGGFLFLGRRWMAAAAFPAAFLMFMVPLPARVVDWLETASVQASTDVATFFFRITGTPVLRQGTVLQLPDITIRVAQQCSGIHSSWVLFITSLVASYIFLHSPWRRAALVAFVIPLGILRNGFRILVIGLLCVHVGPRMIDSPIHHHGGPLFFALSLVPLYLLLRWLMRADGARKIPPVDTKGFGPRISCRSAG